MDEHQKAMGAKIAEALIQEREEAVKQAKMARLALLVAPDPLAVEGDPKLYREWFNKTREIALYDS